MLQFMKAMSLRYAVLPSPKVFSLPLSLVPPAPDVLEPRCADAYPAYPVTLLSYSTSSYPNPQPVKSMSDFFFYILHYETKLTLLIDFIAVVVTLSLNVSPMASEVRRLLCTLGSQVRRVLCFE